MKQILLFIWQLPQNIIGAIYYLLIKSVYVESNDIVKGTKLICKSTSNGSVSLGMWIFISKNAWLYRKKSVIMHESGHCIQSIYLGPLYLFVIGIPSILWAGVRRLGLFKNKSYYSFYTEKWANKLASYRLAEILADTGRH